MIDELLREAIGSELRRRRLARRERLEDTAARAGISPQYLSEIERGRKDASSEMVAAVIGALESNLADVLVAVARELDTASAQVIDIRSLTRLGSDGDVGRASDAVLSVAA
jgi:transcriptional regulator with XRE-family HTH domain